jgi:hypothetical protein
MMMSICLWHHKQSVLMNWIFGLLIVVALVTWPNIYQFLTSLINQFNQRSN